MTVTFQLSDKRGDAILLVKAEGPGTEIDAIYSAFGGAVQDAGLEESLNRFGQGLTQAVTAAQPLVQPQEPWGNPPVPPMQQPPIYAVQQQQPAQPLAQYVAQQQAPMPAAAGPICHHGQKTYLEKMGKNGKPWKAWACPADRNDPTKCELDFIR